MKQRCGMYYVYWFSKHGVCEVVTRLLTRSAGRRYRCGMSFCRDLNHCSPVIFMFAPTQTICNGMLSLILDALWYVWLALKGINTMLELKILEYPQIWISMIFKKQPPSSAVFLGVWDIPHVGRFLSLSLAMLQIRASSPARYAWLSYGGVRTSKSGMKQVGVQWS